MNVHVEILFDSPTEQDWEDMRSLARSLTNDRDSIRVHAGKEPCWLVAQFTMPTETQDKAVGKIDGAIRFEEINFQHGRIRCPRTAAQEARAKRKNERRKAIRKARRMAD